MADSERLHPSWDPLVTALALAMALGSGCSLMQPERTSCATNGDCRAAFGALSSCAPDGTCGGVETIPRCDLGAPIQLFGDALGVAPDETGGSIPSGPPILLGSIMDRSLETHQAREMAIELAASQANEVGGVDGRPVAVLFCTAEENGDIDALSRTDASVTIARYLTETVGVDAIIGPSASSDVLAVQQAVAASNTLIVSPSATSPALTEADNPTPTDQTPGTLWRTAPPDSVQGRVIADDMAARSIERVAVVHATGAYGEELARVFFNRFRDREGTTVDLLPFSDVDSLGQATRDEALGVDDAEHVPFDAILFISAQASEVVEFLRLVHEADVVSPELFLTDGAANGDVLQGIRDFDRLFPLIRGTQPSLPEGFIYDLFVASYDLAYREDVTRFSFTAHAYDATWLALYAVGWAIAQEGSELSGDHLARGLRRLSGGESAPAFDVRASSLAGILQAFRMGTPVELTGASGTLDYDPTSEETVSPIDLWTLSEDGTRIVVVDTKAP